MDTVKYDSSKRGKTRFEQGIVLPWTYQLLMVDTDDSQGDSVAHAFESVVKASHLNITKGTSETVGGQLLMQSVIFDRLGILRIQNLSCIALSHLSRRALPVLDLQ